MEAKIKKAKDRKHIKKSKNQVKFIFPVIDRSVYFGAIKSEEDPLQLQKQMRDEKY